jgi:hypothetical protein
MCLFLSCETVAARDPDAAHDFPRKEVGGSRFKIWAFAGDEGAWPSRMALSAALRGLLAWLPRGQLAISAAASSMLTKAPVAARPVRRFASPMILSIILA